MKFYSNNTQMITDAETLPEGKNIKIVMRHSIRFDNPPDGDYSKLLLTPEGIELAKKIGASIERPVGACAASKVERCNQTVEAILCGIDSSLKPENIIIDRRDELCAMKGNPGPKESGGMGWFEYYIALQNRDLKGSGGITLEEECKPIIDYIFSAGGEENKLDIFCTHDGHIVMLASYLFDLKTGLHAENWVNFTEGIFFYGTRENFTAVFRGETRSFKNILM